MCSNEDGTEHVEDCISVLKINTGDNILVAMRDNGLFIDAQNIKEVLEERFPGVDFTIVVGASGLGKLEP